MKLTFLGTRGYIEPRSSEHYMHSALMVSYYGTEVLIDCGEDWLSQVSDLEPEAIFVTHAHPDHAGGLREGAPSPVYATAETWKAMQGFRIRQRRTIVSREPVTIRRLSFEAFAVAHSTRAPAVGYRVAAGRVAIFYVPDVVYIYERGAALSGVRVYVGDGATIVRSMVRKPGDALIGHAPIRTQLTWCAKEGIARAIFTHCGSEIVAGDPSEVAAQVQALAQERGVEASIAHDGLELVLR